MILKKANAETGRSISRTRHRRIYYFTMPKSSKQADHKGRQPYSCRTSKQGGRNRIQPPAQPLQRGDIARIVEEVVCRFIPELPRQRRDNDGPSTPSTSSSQSSLDWGTKMDLADVTRNLYGHVQMVMALDNWAEMPASLATQVDDLVARIKPPRDDADLRTELQLHADIFKMSIAGSIRNHLGGAIESNRAMLAATCTNVDKEVAISIAKQRLIRTYGTRLPKDTSTMLENVMVPPHSTKTGIVKPLTSNASNLEHEIDALLIDTDVDE